LPAFGKLPCRRHDPGIESRLGLMFAQVAERRNNLRAADRKQPADQFQSRAMLAAIASAPVEHRRPERLQCQGIWPLSGEIAVGVLEFRVASAAHRLRQLAGKIAKKRKRPRRSPFLAHEHQRRHRRQQCHRERRLDGRFRRQHGKTIAERAVADLIVVLQEADEGGRGECTRWLSALGAFAMGRGFALIGEAR
jgi:hypothetical protein